LSLSEEYTGRIGLYFAQHVPKLGHILPALIRMPPQASIAPLEGPSLPPLYQLQAQLQTAQIALLTEQIRTLEQAVQGELLATPAIQQLLWIPGIGRIVAFTLALEVGDIQRFPTVRHFWSYCRLVPGAADSGERHRHRPSKDGNRYLKLAFSHATVRAIQYFPEVRSGTSAGSARSLSGLHGRWSRRNSRRACMWSSTATWSSTSGSKGRRSRGRNKHGGPGGQAPLPN
jgi:transposase